MLTITDISIRLAGRLLIDQGSAQILPGARFVPIADAGHYPQIEQPEKVAGAIEDFARG